MVGSPDVVGTVAIAVVVGITVVGGCVPAQVPDTHKFFVGSKYDPAGQVYEYKRITPAIKMQRLYFVQSVGSGKVPSVVPHWNGANVVDGVEVVAAVVIAVVVGGSVVGQAPVTHKFLAGSKDDPDGQVYVYKRITPAIIMHLLYFVQSVGSGKVPSVVPHWNGAIVVDATGVASGVVDSGVVSETVVISVVVGGDVVRFVAGQVPTTQPGMVPSK